MAKLYGNVAIALSYPELQEAIELWIGNKTWFNDYRVVNLTLHPQGVYPIRFTVIPPMKKADQDKILQVPSDASSKS